MTHGGDLLTQRDDAAARPNFTQQVRGYDKRQVDQYLNQLDRQIASLTTDRKRAAGQAQDLTNQVQDLTAQLKQLQAELNEVRQRPARVDRASFRHLGPMVDQILALAEKQAGVIIDNTEQKAAEHQGKAEKALAEAQERAEKLIAEGEAARERSEAEAKRVHEQSVEHMEKTRAEADALAEAARQQVLQEVKAGRAQAQQELAQWKAAAQREIEELKGAVERELTEARQNTERDLTQQRQASDQKNAALHADAQKYAADLRKRSDEENARHQQQLAVVQQDVQARQKALTQLQAEHEATQTKLIEGRRESAELGREVNTLQQRLAETKQSLTSELTRLEHARQAADSAERHAKEVRARVQREAKRVADLAAAAVMAAAAGGGDTGEYPKVPAPVQVRQVPEQLPTQPDSASGQDARREESPEQA
ncbi:hypothetical protein ACPPVO_46760 [Dactylosporangium sp. McL0621]|uniref:hypothetical protein n=1 Tax=Dactylosporangium sp. McL0621 TaxID=3415678 RepID=UPI003CF08BA9